MPTAKMSHRSELLLALALLSVPGAVRAQGAHLYWDACGLTNPPAPINKCWACDGNGDFGRPRLAAFASFVAPAGVQRFHGVEIVIDVTASMPSMPPWWEFVNADACRRTSLTHSFPPPPDSSACSDPWPAGPPSVSAMVYQRSHFGPRLGRLAIGWAVQPGQETPLETDREYLATMFEIDVSRTTGANACEGCDERVELQLQWITLAQPVGAPGGDFHVTPGPSGGLIHWQNTALPGCVTPVRNVTWARVKSLYP